MDVGGVQLDFLGHAGFLVVNKEGKRLAIDPYNVAARVDKVDVILITHTHFDHCSIKDIEHLARRGTIIVVPADAQSKITRIKGVEMHVVEVGEEMRIGPFKVEAVPAYTIDKKFHPKREGWVGYVIKLDPVIVYHAGDSDHIPEMAKLSGYGKEGNCFVALLPVSGTYVMTAEEATRVAALLRPDYAIPMHYGAGVAGTPADAERFVELCKQEGVHACLLERIT